MEAIKNYDFENEYKAYLLDPIRKLFIDEINKIYQRTIPSYLLDNNEFKEKLPIEVEIEIRQLKKELKEYEQSKYSSLLFNCKS